MSEAKRVAKEELFMTLETAKKLEAANSCTLHSEQFLTLGAPCFIFMAFSWAVE